MGILGQFGTMDNLIPPSQSIFFFYLGHTLYTSGSVKLSGGILSWCQIVPVPNGRLLHCGSNLSTVSNCLKIIPEKKLFCNMMPVDRIKTNWLGGCRVGAW